MQRKRKGLLALWMVWVLLLTTIPVPAGADGTDITVNLYKDTAVLKPGSQTSLWDSASLSPGMALDAGQTAISTMYGADLNGNCPKGYTMDGWRIWKDESGLKAGRWVSDTDTNWDSYLTGPYDPNNGTVILAPNWVPEYAAGEADTAEGMAAVIKKVKTGNVLVNGNTVTGGSIEADGSVKADGIQFSFQWLHGYKVVAEPADSDQIKGTVTSESGDYYNESTGKWMKGGGQSGALDISCELQAGDIVVIRDIGNGYSDCPYYFSGFLGNNDTYSQTYFEMCDRENKVFYAVAPDTGSNYSLYMSNINNIMEMEASVSVFRADASVTNQTGPVYTGGAGTYCCKVSYKADAGDGTGGTVEKTFEFLSDVVTVAEKYEITNECGENGSCTIEIDGKEVTGAALKAEAGQEVTVKAVPDTGYEEGTVSVRKTGELEGADVPYTTTEDGNGNKVRTFTMPDYPVTISAGFTKKAPKTYTVTLPEGTGYTAEAGEGSASPVTEGGSYSFTVTVQPGYEASENYRVLSNGTELKAAAGSTYTYTIENITSNQTITVEGIAKVKEEEKDEEKPVISGVEGGGTYYGPVSFQIKDASPVEVWVDGKQIEPDTAGAYTIQPDNEQHTITAADEAGNTVTCTITVYEEWVKAGIINICGENGTSHIEVDGKEVTGSSIHAAPGQTVTVKAVPDTGYEEGTVSVRKTGELEGADVPYTTTEDGNGNKVRTFTMPDYPVTISAGFTKKAPKTYTVTLPEGTGYTAEAGEGSASPVTEGGSYSFTVTVQSGYEASENYRVLSNGTELKAAVGSTYTYTIENITSNQTITVEGIAKVKEEEKDEEKPVISGVEGGGMYYGPVSFQVKDASPVEVWVDGKQIEPDTAGAYTIQPDNEQHTITAADEAGNTVTCTITVYETWVRDGIAKDGDYLLKTGTAYRLGSGNWKVSEDDTIYAGGNIFYVPIAKRYTLVLQSGIRSGMLNPLKRTFLKW